MEEGNHELTLGSLLAAADGSVAPATAVWLARLEARKIVQPSAVQQAVIPHVRAGRDVLAQSQTGSGKTLAYLLPVLEKVNVALRQPQVLIVVPTRELVMQVWRESQSLLEGGPLLAAALAGGADIRRQLDKLKEHPHVIVGTPGRLLELINKRKLRMHDVRTIVLDEADQLLKQGFLPDIEALIKCTLRERQMLLFSATLGREVRTLAGRWMREPECLEVSQASRTPGQLAQYAVQVEERDKIDEVRRLTHAVKPRAALVFVNEMDELGEILAKLQFVGLTAALIYAQQGQMERAEAMRSFREGRAQLLVATDVAARGLDFPDVELVINYDLPQSDEHYLHRVGRTARMGRSGTAITLFTKFERKKLEQLARKLGAPIEERKVKFGNLVR